MFGASERICLFVALSALTYYSCRFLLRIRTPHPSTVVAAAAAAAATSVVKTFFSHFAASV